MTLPTTANAVYDNNTGDLLRWATGVDLSAADDFDSDNETYRTDLPYPGKLESDKNEIKKHNFNGGSEEWEEKLIIIKSDSIYPVDGFNDLDNWDIGSGGSFDLFDDLPDASIFSPKCLRLPASTTGRIALKVAQVNVADQWVEVHGYNRVDDADSMMWYIGLRVDYINDHGYYVGFDSTGVESVMEMIVRISGVNHVIFQGDGLRGLGILPDQELIFRAYIKDGRIGQEVLKASDSSLLVSMHYNDSNITASGQSGIAIFTSSPVSQRLDGFEVYNMQL